MSHHSNVLYLFVWTEPKQSLPLPLFPSSSVLDPTAQVFATVSSNQAKRVSTL